MFIRSMNKKVMDWERDSHYRTICCHTKLRTALYDIPVIVLRFESAQLVLKLDIAHSVHMI